MSRSRWVLVDGTGLLYRAYHALPSTLTTSSGLPTNAVYGFAQMFRRILQGREVTHGAVVFDAGGSTFRHELDPGYKRRRPRMPETLRRQLNPVHELVRAHGFPILQIPGVEADDVLATLVRGALDEDATVTLVSGDKDFVQLLGDDRVRLFDSTTDIFYDADRARRKWGVPPELFEDYLALVGDTADDVPGIPGLGKTHAVRLLTEHGPLETLLERADTLGSLGRTLSQHAERARLSKRLVTLKTDVPLPGDALDIPTPDVAALNAVYRRFEFFSLLTAEGPTAPGRVLQYYVVDSVEMAQAALVNECLVPRPVGLHLLTEFDATREVVGIALSPKPGLAFWFPIRGPGLVLPDLEVLRGWLNDPRFPKVTHDGRQMRVDLQRLGLSLDGVVGDSALAAYLLDPTRGLPHRLEQVARTTLHRALQPLNGLVGSGRSRKRFQELTVDRAGAYANHLADAVGACWDVQRQTLEEDGLLDILEDVDLPLAALLARVQQHGVLMDPGVLKRLGEGFVAERDAVAHQVHALAGRPFTIGSVKQLGSVLFDELGLPVIKRTKTGYSTAADVLDQLVERHPIVALVQRWRTLDTLVNTYTEVLVDSVDPQTGRIHATFQQTVSASGRIITTNPDLQRTPVRSPEFIQIREAFVAPAGCVLLSADWSQIELRLLAHLSEDPLLLEAFSQGLDLHTRTAAAIFGIDESTVNPTQRGLGKTVNFATLYGQGATALAQQLDIPHQQAKHAIETFFTTYAGVARWRDEVVALAHLEGFVTTLMGRRRQVPELSTKNFSDRAYGERIAMNTPVQGSAADLCKKAMLDVDRLLRAEGLGARLVLQIHDELLFEVPEEEVEATTALVRQGMSTVWPLRVPLVVDVGVGATWAATKPA